MLRHVAHSNLIWQNRTKDAQTEEFRHARFRRAPHDELGELGQGDGIQPLSRFVDHHDVGTHEIENRMDQTLSLAP